MRGQRCHLKRKWPSAARMPAPHYTHTHTLSVSQLRAITGAVQAHGYLCAWTPAAAEFLLTDARSPLTLFVSRPIIISPHLTASTITIRLTWASIWLITPNFDEFTSSVQVLIRPCLQLTSGDPTAVSHFCL